MMTGSVAEHPIKVTKSTVSVGSLLQSMSDYRAKNPLAIERGAIRVANEELQLYAGREYLRAVQSVLMFAGECLSEAWDQHLTALCAER